MEGTDRCLVLFSKPARAGRVKTRLIGELSPQQAADLHAAFLEDLLTRLRRGRFSLRIAWALAQDEPVPPAEVQGRRQEGTELGERMFRALAAEGRAHHWVAVVGSDHPDLPLSLVNEAFDKLARGADVVLGPAEDGGYYLLAVASHALRKELFEGIEWSSHRVLEATLARCRELGLKVELLPPAADVDTTADLRRLIATLERDPDVDCPRTRNLLAAWGYLPTLHAEGDTDENP